MTQEPSQYSQTTQEEEGHTQRCRYLWKGEAIGSKQPHAKGEEGVTPRRGEHLTLGPPYPALESATTSGSVLAKDGLQFIQLSTCLR
jgi:hypothetical protein